MFTDNWEIPGTNVRFTLGDRYEADALTKIADNRSDPHLVARLIHPATFTNGNGTQPTGRGLTLVPASSVKIDRQAA